MKRILGVPTSPWFFFGAVFVFLGILAVIASIYTNKTYGNFGLFALGASMFAMHVFSVNYSEKAEELRLSRSEKTLSEFRIIAKDIIEHTERLVEAPTNWKVLNLSFLFDQFRNALESPALTERDEKVARVYSNSITEIVREQLDRVPAYLWYVDIYAMAVRDSHLKDVDTSKEPRKARLDPDSDQMTLCSVELMGLCSDTETEWRDLDFVFYETAEALAFHTGSKSLSAYAQAFKEIWQDR